MKPSGRRAEAQRALQTDASLPDAHSILGYLAAIYDRDWTVAERHFDFPMAKQVGLTVNRPLYAWFQFSRGNVEQAIELAQHAIEEDPLEVWPRMNLHAYLQAAGREREALGQLKKVLELDASQAVALVSLAMIHGPRQPAGGTGDRTACSFNWALVARNDWCSCRPPAAQW